MEAVVLTLFLAQAVMPRRLAGTASALTLAGRSTLVLMSAMNFVLQSDFRWALMIPALLWLAGLVAYVVRG
jgi:hypothetical protein